MLSIPAPSVSQTVHSNRKPPPGGGSSQPPQRSVGPTSNRDMITTSFKNPGLLSRTALGSGSGNFVAHLGSANHNDDVGANTFQICDQSTGLIDVPDVMPNPTILGCCARIASRISKVGCWIVNSSSAVWLCNSPMFANKYRSPNGAWTYRAFNVARIN